MQMEKGKARWSMIADDIWDMILGKAGRLPGPLAPEIVEKAKAEGRQFFEGNPQDNYPDALDKYRKLMNEKQWEVGEDEEELFEYAMHPAQYEAYRSGKAKVEFKADVAKRKAEKANAGKPTVPATPAAPAPARRPLISGASLSELLASAGSDPDEELSDGETPDEAEVVTVDPECAEKLEHARSRILNLIKEKRPRFVPAFELMTFRDNTISVSVPTSELREEILRSKTGMLMRIAELAGIEGMIELEVIVNEEIRAVRPIKLEDRVRYITEKNPLVAELRKALDLEVE